MEKNNGVLSGIRVLDMADEYGVYCTKLMAQMGAEVIKVEPLDGDSTRRIGPFAQDDSKSLEKSLFHAFYNEGKKSITLDYARPEGREVFLRLVRQADVLVETFEPGRMKELGLDYPVLKEVNPKLVMCSITPFGQEGPYSHYRASSDMVPFAMTGPMMEYGDPEREPLQLGQNILANGAGMVALAGISAVLYAREEDGQGDFVSVSLSEVAGTWRNMALGIPQMSPEHKPFIRMGSQGSFIPANYYKCKDGYVFIMASGKWAQCAKWLKDVGIDIGDKDDPKYLEDAGYNKYLWADADQVNEMMSELSLMYTKKDMMEEGQRRGVPVGTSETPDTVMQNEHFIARKMFHTVDSPAVGAYQTVAPGCTFSGMDTYAEEPAPLLGADNAEIFAAAGLTWEEIGRLQKAGIIGGKVS